MAASAAGNRRVDVSLLKWVKSQVLTQLVESSAQGAASRDAASLVADLLPTLLDKVRWSDMKALTASHLVVSACKNHDSESL